MDTMAEGVGQRLKLVLGSRGLSIRAVSELLGVHMITLGLQPKGCSYGTMRNYYTGNVARPNKIVLTAMADFLDVRPEWLMYGEGPRVEGEAPDDWTWRTEYESVDIRVQRKTPNGVT